jgi:transposase
VLDTPKPPLAVTADKAYDSEKVRQQIKDDGALPIIPSRCNATKKAYCPKRFYQRRHKIENYFCRIKDWRRIATRYDKQTRSKLPCRHRPRRGALLDQIVSPDPSCGGRSSGCLSRRC